MILICTIAFRSMVVKYKGCLPFFICVYFFFFHSFSKHIISRAWRFWFLNWIVLSLQLQFPNCSSIKFSLYYGSNYSLHDFYRSYPQFWSGDCLPTTCNFCYLPMGQQKGVLQLPKMERIKKMIFFYLLKIHLYRIQAHSYITNIIQI